MPILAAVAAVAGIHVHPAVPAVRGKASGFPAFAGVVPVLLYHRLVAEPRAVAPTDFEAEMRRLHDLGFQAITLDTYLRFMRGERVRLPQRPILITFDDGYVSSWKIADPVLARYGWTAVMYIPTGFVGLPEHLTWEQLRTLWRSGRWEIEEHAGDGHVSVPIDATGRTLPYYAAERWLNGRRETFAEYKRRVSRDIRRGAELLAQHLPGWLSHGTFAVPFGDYGQRGSDDPRIEPWFSAYLRSRFAVTFVQAIDRFVSPGLGFADRMAVTQGWDGQTLELHLLRAVSRLRTRS